MFSDAFWPLNMAGSWFWAVGGTELPTHMKITSKEDPKSWSLGPVSPGLLRPQGSGHFRPYGFQEATPSGHIPALQGQLQLTTQKEMEISTTLLRSSVCLPRVLVLGLCLQGDTGSPSPSIHGQIQSLTSLPPISFPPLPPQAFEICLLQLYPSRDRPPSRHIHRSFLCLHSHIQAGESEALASDRTMLISKLHHPFSVGPMLVTQPL